MAASTGAAEAAAGGDGKGGVPVVLGSELDDFFALLTSNSQAVSDAESHSGADMQHLQNIKSQLQEEAAAPKSQAGMVVVAAAAEATDAAIATLTATVPVGVAPEAAEAPSAAVDQPEAAVAPTAPAAEPEQNQSSSATDSSAAAVAQS
jgi:hypothetical protein